MITIITGTPGAGKTALAVAMAMEITDRPIFVWGIPELKLPHTPAPPVAEWTTLITSEEDDTKTRPVFTFPPSALVIIDESQNVYRPRGSGSKVPDHVAALETHRHGGIDFWLITQHPRLLDGNVKELCGRHIHLRNTALGRYLYEWPEAADPKSSTERSVAAVRRYKLPKKVFGVYKSASLHVKQSRRLPNSAYFVIGALAVGGYFAYGFYGSMSKLQGEVSGATVSNGALNAGAPGASGQGAQIPSVDPALAYARSYQPRLAGYAHTAEAYQGITQPRRVPIPAACIATEKRCSCYTQDATPYALPESDCREIVKGGIFLPFDPEGPQQGGEGGRAASTASRPATIAQVEQRSGPSIASIPDYGDFVGVSSRTRQN